MQCDSRGGPKRCLALAGIRDDGHGSADPTSSVGAADRLGRSAAAPVHPFDSELSYPNTTHPANVHLNLTFS